MDSAVEEVDAFLADLSEDESDEPVEEALSDPAGESANDWLVDELLADEADINWLSDSDEDEAEGIDEREVGADAFAFDDFDDGEMGFDEPELEDAFAAAPQDEADDFDWLSDMEAIETGELVVRPEPDSEEWKFPEDQPATEPEAILEVDEDSVPDEVSEDSWTSETFFAETAVGEDLPGWLSQLDEADEQAEVAEPSNLESSDEEIPDWIASMRPSQGIVGSELPGVFPEIDLRDTLEGIPEELAGAELPDWLQDTPLDSAPPPVFEAPNKEAQMEIPDWLQPDAGETESGVSQSGVLADQPEAGSSRDEWRSLLEELPPLTPLAESLPKAEIPEWVQQLKPRELTGEPPREPEGPEEQSGPLKGLQGIVTIEPSIARPRSVALAAPYVTTPEQQQQVALLHQLTQEAPETLTSLETKSAYDTAVWLRISLAILLIVVLLVGLRGPGVVALGEAVPTNVQAVETAVSAAAGQPVLVAVEYTPAMAGELSPQAELLLAQLEANGSPVLITSQYAAGTAVASNLPAAANARMIGYLPGETIGLRQLGNCLAARSSCEELNGRVLDANLQADLSQVGLVIVLTGDRDSLVNWIEQVGSLNDGAPLVAGVTQALTPLARSYAATDLLNGFLGGIPETAVYEQLVTLPESDVRSRLNAQILGQLLAGTLLLIGLISYGGQSLASSRRQKKQGKPSV